MPSSYSPHDLQKALRSFDTFEGLPDHALKWLVDQAECRLIKEGQSIFEQGQVAEELIILMTGKMVVCMESGSKKREIGLFESGHVTGVLPFSRLNEYTATGTALEDCYVLLLPKDRFVDMVAESYELTQALVAIMTERVRSFQQQLLSDEKMMALGKMSAGLAHELNNPASAIVRASHTLYEHLHQTPEQFKQVISMPIDEAMIDAINDLLFSKTAALSDVELDLLEREERLDDINDWLQQKGIEEAEDMADHLVDYGFSIDDLSHLALKLPQQALGPVLGWIETNLRTEQLVHDIRTAGERIADLISSIKTYTHMDQEQGMAIIGIEAGLQSTLTILKHRFQQQGVTLEKDIDPALPKVRAVSGELNQVWTNLLANALDVLPEGGRIKIRAYAEREHICMEIEDNGPGIPEDIRPRIFDPFFTTKDIGKGTGMGLDIVRRIVERHNGDLSVQSEPGRSCFRVCLPVYQPEESIAV